MRKKKEVEETSVEETEQKESEVEAAPEAESTEEVLESEDSGISEEPERKTWKITCSDCGKEAEVPFEPTDGRPVYCRDCFMKHRKPRGNFGRRRF